MFATPQAAAPPESQGFRFALGLPQALARSAARSAAERRLLAEWIAIFCLV